MNYPNLQEGEGKAPIFQDEIIVYVRMRLNLDGGLAVANPRAAWNIGAGVIEMNAERCREVLMPRSFSRKEEKGTD